VQPINVEWLMPMSERLGWNSMAKPECLYLKHQFEEPIIRSRVVLIVSRHKDNSGGQTRDSANHAR
jgi:hypothetical protein